MGQGRYGPSSSRCGSTSTRSSRRRRSCCASRSLATRRWSRWRSARAAGSGRGGFVLLRRSGLVGINQGVSSCRAACCLCRKSLNVADASSKISVGLRGISTETFGAGSGDAGGKITLLLAHPLISRAPTITVLRNARFLRSVFILHLLDAFDESGVFALGFVLLDAGRLLNLCHGAVVASLDQPEAVQLVSPCDKAQGRRSQKNRDPGPAEQQGDHTTSLRHSAISALRRLCRPCTYTPPAIDQFGPPPGL